MKNFFVYFYEVVRLFHVPVLKGVLLGGLPTLCFYALVVVVLNNTSFLGLITNSYDSFSISVAETVTLKTNRQLAVLIGCSFCFLQQFGAQFVSQLSEEDERFTRAKLLRQHFKQSEKRQRKNRAHHPKKTDSVASVSSRVATEEAENLTPKYFTPAHDGFLDLNSLYTMKARGFFACMFFSALPLVYFMSLKTMDYFTHNLYVFVFPCIFFSVFCSGVISALFDRELLLLSPLVSSSTLCIFYTFLRQDTYEFYLASTICAVIYSFFKISYFLTVKYHTVAERLRKSGMAPTPGTAQYYYVLYREKIKRFFRALGIEPSKEKKVTQHTKFDFQKPSTHENSRENILFFLMDSACKCVAYLLRFSTGFFNVVSPTSRTYDLPSTFNAQMLINNIVFSVILLFGEVVTMFLCETYFDYELLNLLNFYRFRFQRRQTDWLFDKMLLDESIEPAMRSLDFAGFSVQFFLVLSGLTASITVLAYLIFVSIERRFNMFQDAAIILIVFMGIAFTYGVCVVVRWAANALGFWSRSSQDPGERLGSFFRLENYTLTEFDPMSEPFIVEDFIDQQRDFIIRNLDKILRPEDFLRHEGFLIDLASKVTSNVKALEIGSLKDEIIDRYCYVAALHSDDYSNYVVRTHPAQFYNLATIMHYWLSLGKEAVYFRKLTEGMAAESLKGLCQDCHSDENLVVEERNSFQKILSFYRVHLKGGLPRQNDWRDFYRRHQVFVTLCENCEKIRRIKRFKKSHVLPGGTYGKATHQSDFSERILKDLIRSDLQPTTKYLMMQWWLVARSRLLRGQGALASRGGTASHHDQLMRLLDEYESNC